jgi:hypothetical protein
MEKQETKTVELPLTRSERRHQANIERRDRKRARSQTQAQHRNELRDAILEINRRAREDILKIQERAHAERKAAEAEYRKKREKAGAEA